LPSEGNLYITAGVYLPDTAKSKPELIHRNESIEGCSSDGVFLSCFGEKTSLHFFEKFYKIYCIFKIFKT